MLHRDNKMKNANAFKVMSEACDGFPSILSKKKSMQSARKHKLFKRIENVQKKLDLSDEYIENTENEMPDDMSGPHKKPRLGLRDTSIPIKFSGNEVTNVPLSQNSAIIKMEGNSSPKKKTPCNCKKSKCLKL